MVSKYDVNKSGKLEVPEALKLFDDLESLGVKVHNRELSGISSCLEVDITYTGPGFGWTIGEKTWIDASGHISLHIELGKPALEKILELSIK